MTQPNNPQYPAPAPEQQPAQHRRLVPLRPADDPQRTHGTPSWVNRAIGSVIVAIVVLLVLALVVGGKGGKAASPVDVCKNIAGVQARTPSGYNDPNKRGVCTTQGGNHGKQPTKASKGLINALSVRTVSSSCNKLEKAYGGKAKIRLVSYDIGALKPVKQGGRKWSDALSTPLGGKSPPQQRTALKTAICRDPLLGATWANFLAHLTVLNVNVGHLNPWLAPYKGSPSQINNKAAGFVPLLDVKHPNAAQVRRAIKRNHAYVALANRVDTLIGRFSVLGDKSQKSSENLHLVAGGLKVSGLPEVGVNPRQENLPALQLVVTEKGACAPVKTIGANRGDKRPELFPTPTCKTPKKHPRTPRGCTTNCGGCSSNCSSAPPTHQPPPSSAPPSPSSSHPVCVCPSKVSQTVPAPSKGPVKSTGGSGPPNHGKGNSPTPTAPGGKPSGPTGSANPTEPGGGGNNSSPIPEPTG